MRIITINFNGIRSAAGKGFYNWMARQKADVVCFQETKAQVDQLTTEMLAPKGYHGYFHDAEKKGYSGVAVFTRRQPDNIRIGLDLPEFDAEGRYIQADFGDLSIASLYLPSGSSSEIRQEAKFRFMDQFTPIMQEMIRLHVAGELEGPPAAFMASRRPAEELYDTDADPWEIENLAGDPAHSEVLERHRRALDTWQVEAGDLGFVTETEMVARMWPDGVQPTTLGPTFTVLSEVSHASRPRERMSASVTG